jgi:hypothetical protein
MAYMEPTQVTAPRALVRSVDVLYNTGPGGWSVARLEWEDHEVLGVRWNGEEGPGIGNPQSRGVPTWFVVPDELRASILDRVEELTLQQAGGLLAQYQEMARDEAREAEALEWSEGLIADASGKER